MKERIAIAGPWITQKEISYVTDAVSHAWYDKANDYQQRFETAFAAYVGRTYAISLPSCTSALHLALLGLGVGPGDEVILPEITWIASSAPVSYVGATPVFADIDPTSWCLDAASFEACITPKTKAVILVDLYGNMPDMDAIERIAKAHGVAIIEDAAQAIGSEYRRKKAGAFGAASTFSFHGSKTLTTGEGGMLTTDDKALYDRIRFLRDHGRIPGETMFWNTEIGYKYCMSSLQAALGLAQLERIEELIARKRETFLWYQEALSDCKEITLNSEAPGVKNSYWMVTAIVDPKLGQTKADLMKKLAADNIDTRPFFHPLSMLPAYSHLAGVKKASERNVNAYRLSPYGLNLPSNLKLTKETVQYVSEKFKQILYPSLAGATGRR